MLQINPSENFPIVRKLPDPSDTGTYYVQAFVRDSITDTLLATVKLTDLGGGRFKNVWRAVQAPNGTRYVDITTKVYTDSGYTTQGSIYGDESETYQIALRWSLQTGGSGSSVGQYSGGDISYKKIEEIVRKVVEELLPKYEKVDYEKIAGSLKVAPTDLSSVENAIRSIPETIDAMKKAMSDEISKNKLDQKSIEKYLTDSVVKAIVEKIDNLTGSLRTDEEIKTFFDKLSLKLEKTAFAYEQSSAKIDGEISAQFTRVLEVLKDYIDNMEIGISSMPIKVSSSKAKKTISEQDIRKIL